MNKINSRRFYKHQPALKDREDEDVSWIQRNYFAGGEHNTKSMRAEIMNYNQKRQEWREL